MTLGPHVRWYPWGAEALRRHKKKTNRFSCLLVMPPVTGTLKRHSIRDSEPLARCHVMERESFENADVAALMNELFVNVKVDREERPDVARMYMTFVQALTGGGTLTAGYLFVSLKTCRRMAHECLADTRPEPYMAARTSRRRALADPAALGRAYRGQKQSVCVALRCCLSVRCSLIGHAA